MNILKWWKERKERKQQRKERNQVIRAALKSCLDEEDTYEERKIQKLYRQIQQWGYEDFSSSELILVSSAWKRTLREITREEYREWLAEYIKSGGKIGDCRETFRGRWDWDYDKILIATQDIFITPLYGKRGLEIVVPEGITITGDLGHNHILSLTDKRADLPPIFKDLV